MLLLFLALNHRLIPAAVGQPALLALIMTMALAPLLIQHYARMVIGLIGPPGLARPLEEETQLAEQGAGMARHIIVCGAGRIGRLVARGLEAAHLPCLVIESNYLRHREAVELGLRSVFGDATRPGSLRVAGLDRAGLVVVTFSNIKAIERLVYAIRQHAPAAALLVSLPDEREVSRLMALGVTAIFPENLAAGLALSEQALRLAGLPGEEATAIIMELRTRLNLEGQGRS